MAGLRLLRFAGYQLQDQADFAKLGYIIPTRPPWRVGNGNSPADNADLIAQLGRDCLRYDINLAFEVPDAGTDILVDKSVWFENPSVTFDIGGRGGGGTATRARNVALLGIPRNGQRPCFRIPDGTSLSRLNLGEVSAAQFPDFPAILGEGYGLFGWRSYDTAKEFNNRSSQNYCAEVQDLDFAVGNNPGVFALYGAGAQACFFARIKILVEEGLAGFCDLPGSGANSLNIEIAGGDYGIIQRDYRPTPSAGNCAIHDQRKAGILNLNERGSLVLNGCRIWGSAPDFRCVETPQSYATISGGSKTNNNGEGASSRNLATLNCKFKVEGDAAGNPAIDCYDSNLNLRDSWFDAATIAHTGKNNSPDIILSGAAGQWAQVEHFWTAMKSSQGSAYVDGVESNPSTGNLSGQHAAPVIGVTPKDDDWLARVHGFRETEVLRPWAEPWKFAFYGGTSDDPLFDHGPPLMALGETCRTPGHANFGKGVCVPKGFFDSQTKIVWPKEVPLTGISQRLSVLRASTEWQPTAETALFETELQDTQLSLIGNLAFCKYEARQEVPLGGAITQADLRAQRFITALHIQGLVKTWALQPVQHEFYGRTGTQASLELAPVVRCSGKASGFVHVLPLDVIDARSENPSDFHMVRINQLTSARRLFIFDLNTEGGGGASQVLIEDANNVVLSPFKAEGGIGVRPPQANGTPDNSPLEERLLIVRRSRGLIVTAFSGNHPVQHLNASSIVLIDTASPGCHIGLWDRTKNEDPSKHMFEVAA